jgi:5-methylcytosine-specific restriction endonuclease McrA
MSPATSSALHAGDRLRSLDGEASTVTAVRNYIDRQLRYNFTVSMMHTYYVLAGDQPVLVHNCGTNANNRSGLDFTDAGRDEVYAANAAAHNGQLTCEYCGRGVTRRPSQSGVPGLPDDAQIDHQIPRACGGCGDPHNGVVACRACNRDKSTKSLEDWDAELREFLPPGLIDATHLNLISLS